MLLDPIFQLGTPQGGMLDDMTETEDHAVAGVFGHRNPQSRFPSDGQIHTGHEGAPAREHNAVAVDIVGNGGGNVLQQGHGVAGNGLNGGGDGLHDLGGKDLLTGGKTRAGVAAEDRHAAAVEAGVADTDPHPQLLGGGGTHHQIALLTEVVHDGGVKALASHLDGASRKDPAHTDGGRLREASADVEHHTAVGLPDTQSRSRGGREYRGDLCHGPRAGLNDGVFGHELLGVPGCDGPDRKAGSRP